MVAPTYNSRTLELKSGGSEVQVHPWLPSEFKTSLSEIHEILQKCGEGECKSKIRNKHVLSSAFHQGADKTASGSVQWCHLICSSLLAIVIRKIGLVEGR